MQYALSSVEKDILYAAALAGLYYVQSDGGLAAKIIKLQSTHNKWYFVEKTLGTQAFSK